MSLIINIELSDRDLEHFDKSMQAARKAAGDKSADEVIQAASKLLETAQENQLPDFISQRLELLDTLIAMVRDEGWALPKDDAEHVLSALVYFAAPVDVIPDSVPVLGLLDDAIMIELCAKELRHEIEAYEDFCDHRQLGSERRGQQPETVGRADWLESRREELLERMNRRRSRDVGTGYGRSSGYGPLNGYASNGWRPSLFRAR